MIPKLVLVLCLIARAHSICLPGCSENQCCIENECVEKHTANCNYVGSATQRSSSKEKSLINRRKETTENLLETDVIEIAEKVRQRRDILPIGNVKDVQRLKKEGEPCGACMCPPTYSAGECERHLECVGNGGIDDAPGRCMVPVICCKALTASCLACKARQTVEEFCSFPKRHVPGCQGNLAKEGEQCAYSHTQYPPNGNPPLECERKICGKGLACEIYGGMCGTCRKKDGSFRNFHQTCGKDYRYNDTDHHGICSEGLECFCSMRCPGICVEEAVYNRDGLMLLTSFDYVRCESHAPMFDYKECSAGGRVRRYYIDNRLMGSKPCYRGRTYGSYEDKIWVDFGCSALFSVLLWDANTYFLSSVGQKCDREITTIEDCKMAAELKGLSYVEGHGDGNQLPHGCVCDKVTPGRTYVYWNKIGGVKSLDPKLTKICEK